MRRSVYITLDTAVTADNVSDIDDVIWLHVTECAPDLNPEAILYRMDNAPLPAPGTTFREWVTALIKCERTARMLAPMGIRAR